MAGSLPTNPGVEWGAGGRGAVVEEQTAPLSLPPPVKVQDNGHVTREAHGRCSLLLSPVLVFIVGVVVGAGVWRCVGGQVDGGSVVMTIDEVSSTIPADLVAPWWWWWW